MNDIKQKILEEIQKHSSVFIKVTAVQYRIRCPMCGDSQKNSRDAHCYIKCTFDPNEPIVFKCHKCNVGGKVTTKFLDKLGIKMDEASALDMQVYNRITSIKKTNINLITGDPVMNSMQVKYIEQRLGNGFTVDDYDKFKIIWNVNTVYPYVSDARTRNMIPSNIDSVSFLSDDKSTLLIRSFMDDGSRWRKLPLFPSENKSFYTIKSTLDLFTKDQIVVNIAEGVFDVLSAYKNFNDGPNSIFIATLGSDYISAVDYAIANGFMGTNVVLKIYIDSDINDRSIKFQLKKFKWLFQKIYIFRNIKTKDIGTTIDKIQLVEHQI